MPKKLTVGIIGVGGIGKVHAKAFKATGQAEIKAICDVDSKTLAAAGEEFGVKTRFGDYRQLLKTDVEAVIVCAGNALHREMAIASLKAGKHVLLEKPMAINGAEAEKIVAAGKGAKGILQIGMTRRQAPAAQIVRQYVEKGLLGKIYHMRTVMIRRRGIPGLGGWFTTKAESGGGPLIDLGVHWFDMAMWLADHWNPTAVGARTYAKFGPEMRDYKYVKMWAGPPRLDGVFDVEDYSTGFVRFDNTASMVFDIAWAANSPGESYVQILGDKGGARILDGKPLQIFTEQEGRLADICPHFDEKTSTFEIQAQKFVAACRGEGPPAATAHQGLIVMKLIDAIYKSGKEGREIAIET